MVREVDVRTIDRGCLKDLANVDIDPSLGTEEKRAEYIKQIGNPCCYIDNGIIVKLSFTDTNVTLEDRLKAYILSL